VDREREFCLHKKYVGKQTKQLTISVVAIVVQCQNDRYMTDYIRQEHEV